ncbi:hypothetical protein PAE9249_01118 [Paenibacillus sp. CECT 9249]|nr:Z-ring formation inhibitor MciZ [Paenibacillus sp. CECT 9249]CAH0118628.1 hypothetical protein PAE9249_01118 [Paenibacillus sp. CECT 9249]
MKSYIASNQMRLVGKAWEIRHHLRQWAKRSGPNASLRRELERRLGPERR